MNLWTSATAEAAETASAKTAAEARMTSEDISEHREDIVHRESAGIAAETSEAASAKATRAVEAELVILLTLLLIRQYCVSLGCLLEFLLSLSLLSIALITLTVRMIFDGNLAVCLFYVCSTGFLINAKYLVIIPFSHVMDLLNF